MTAIESIIIDGRLDEWPALLPDHPEIVAFEELEYDDPCVKAGVLGVNPAIPNDVRLPTGFNMLGGYYLWEPETGSFAVGLNLTHDMSSLDHAIPRYADRTCSWDGDGDGARWFASRTAGANWYPDEILYPSQTLRESYRVQLQLGPRESAIWLYADSNNYGMAHPLRWLTYARAFRNPDLPQVMVPSVNVVAAPDPHTINIPAANDPTDFELAVYSLWEFLPPALVPEGVGRELYGIWITSSGGEGAWGYDYWKWQR